MVKFEWRKIWAGELAGDASGDAGGSVRITRQVPSYPNGEVGRPYWIVNIRPRYREELTLPERFESADAGRAAAEAWFQAHQPDRDLPRRKRWRPVPNRPD